MKNMKKIIKGVGYCKKSRHRKFKYMMFRILFY